MTKEFFKEAFYDIKRAEDIEDNSFCDKQPYEKYCLNCKKRLKVKEQLNGFCENCKNRFQN